MTTEQLQTVLARLQKLIPEETNQELLTQLAGDAEAWVLAYTARTTLPAGLLTTVGDLAVIDYNRLGTQGESARSEGGESYNFETAPARIISILDRYRLARAGGVYHETQPETT